MIHQHNLFYFTNVIKIYLLEVISNQDYCLSHMGLIVFIKLIRFLFKRMDFDLRKTEGLLLDCDSYVWLVKNLRLIMDLPFSMRFHQLYNYQVLKGAASFFSY